MKDDGQFIFSSYVIMSIEKVLSEVFDVYLTEEIMSKVYEIYKKEHQRKMKRCLGRIICRGVVYTFTEKEHSELEDMTAYTNLLEILRDPVIDVYLPIRPNSPTYNIYPKLGHVLHIRGLVTAEFTNFRFLVVDWL